jgi:HNH endonuclease
MNVAGRSSSITNAFISAIIPVIEPSEEEEREALGILRIDPEDIRCAYCGDKATEWDHLRPIISNQEPTGYITEIANLVPSCGKCNQSYENWRQPRKIDFAVVVGPEMWQRHRQNWRSVLELLKKSQELASEIRSIVQRAK